MRVFAKVEYKNPQALQVHHPYVERQHEAVGAPDGTPLQRVLITDCGELDKDGKQNSSPPKQNSSPQLYGVTTRW
jgi:hypothetical protein